MFTLLEFLCVKSCIIHSIKGKAFYYSGKHFETFMITIYADWQ